MRFAFGDQVLDVGRRELLRGGERIALEPEVFDLLVYLVLNRDRVVTKDDLIVSVWGGRMVSDSAVTTRLHAARQAVGDSGAAQHPPQGRALCSRDLRGTVDTESGPRNN
jgi:DNA-binding winged helix-turn-helix (wHTH) protein